MHTYKDGLNYVPLLAAQSTHITNGNGVCLNSAHRSVSPRNGVICYNGNYEGDLSMFGSKRLQRRLELVETDSDTEYKRELEAYQPPQRNDRSQLARLVIYYCDRVVPPSRRKLATAYTSRLYNNTYYQRMREMLYGACCWTLWLLRLVIFSMLRLTNFSYGCWRSCILLRNTARRLLWWMTLAKCGDVKLFFMILLGTPLVFVIAIVGFVLSIYCALRDCLSSSNFFQRFRMK
ncbi:PREDICTED: uncharacterized protein LOC108375387 [Rhagoletis zephyria]|uniref:uncharacterized protein LOC108375387 n=1 Tax=Rhagoletis zephyria TaxID=28612 RepID=UPI0008119E3F|nr:PREDICTED: uncharacterized protein LOC108375387 [Rhagoletis zephyria]